MSFLVVHNGASGHPSTAISPFLAADNSEQRYPFPFLSGKHRQTQLPIASFSV